MSNRFFHSLISKTIVKQIALLGLALTTIASVIVLINLTFIRRLLTYPDNSITNVDWYRPLELVMGNSGDLPRGESPIPPASLKQVMQYAQTHNSSALLVMYQGKLVVEKYWRGFGAKDTFNSMSMSKAIVALLIGTAIAEGHIESELEPVANYITEWSRDQRSTITIQDLLYMQSGLRNQDNTENPFSDLVRMYGGVNADSVALNLPLVAEPGRTFDYNNANTQILSEVLERATGERYSDYLSTRLWQALEADPAYLWLDRAGGDAKPFCCFFASPKDWARVGQLFLDQGQVKGRQVIDATWLKKMLQPSASEPKYGYHIWLKARLKDSPNAYNPDSSVPFVAPDTFYLDGASHQRVYIIPSWELVIVRVGENSAQWDDAMIPNTIVNSLLSYSRFEQN